jgi:16S rRNA processing protein RimM
MAPAPESKALRARREGHNLLVGRIVRPHGVRGDLLVQPLSDIIDSIEPGAAVFLGDRKRAFRIASLRRHGRSYLLRIDDCADRDAAEAHRGAEVRLRLEEAPPLPEGRYYQWQVIGLDVVTEEGRPLGKIREILETGANDVYVVAREAEGDLLLPAITSVVRRIDPEAGRMIVRLMPGLE